jgi:hypothetical protein
MQLTHATQQSCPGSVQLRNETKIRVENIESASADIEFDSTDGDSRAVAVEYYASGIQ